MVFLIWIAPDFVFHGYRSNFLFANAIVGRGHSSIATAALQDHWVCCFGEPSVRPPLCLS